eukprot:TRINITY_DN32462_c0_g1_i1.p1 TRINITY_DN32462_c0_g1~~TRINITY_DN32462_c0_g1_i1.p1  ORF type:complete len:180 (-),score=30.35 TRINITY_DN32462_c0_g1_i1:188-727(-)
MQSAAMLLLGSFIPKVNSQADCPAMRDKDIKEQWRCITGWEDGKPMPDMDQQCLMTLQQRQFWGFEESKPCMEYWNKVWSRLAGEAGSDFYNCVQSEQEKCRQSFGPQPTLDGQVLYAQRSCATAEICKFENSHFGFCSKFYSDEINPHCGSEAPYHTDFCTKVCPTNLGMLEDDPVVS